MCCPITFADTHEAWSGKYINPRKYQAKRGETRINEPQSRAKEGVIQNMDDSVSHPQELGPNGPRHKLKMRSVVC